MKSIFFVLLFASTTASLLGGSFSVLTSNILMHAWYTSYSNKWIVGAEERLSVFDEYMAQVKRKETDILCLQEWPYGDPKIRSEDPIKVLHHSAKAPASEYYDTYTTQTKKEHNQQTCTVFQDGMRTILERHFPSSSYYYVFNTHGKSNDGVLMVIKKDAFNLLCSKVGTFLGSDGQPDESEMFLVAHLAFKRNPQKTVAVASVHIPYDEKTRMRNFALVKHEVAAFAADGSIIAGDFNSANGWDIQNHRLNQEELAIIRRAFDGYALGTDTLPHPTARSGSDNTQLLIDYVLHTPNIRVKESMMLPESAMQNDTSSLLPHTTTEKPTKKMFYSDHAALWYMLNLPSK